MQPEANSKLRVLLAAAIVLVALGVADYVGWLRLKPEVSAIAWIADKPDYDIWRRNNLWMMFNALAIYPRHLTLVALYNRERESDGPGGTAHLVATAQRWGFKTIELDARKLLEP
jgi:hypothetical protein